MPGEPTDVPEKTKKKNDESKHGWGKFNPDGLFWGGVLALLLSSSVVAVVVLAVMQGA